MPEPERIQSNRLGDYLEIMSKAVFQSGISWRVVESKWPGIKEAFKGFDAEAVAGLSEPDLDELAQDTRVIRNRRKLSAIVSNAQRMIALDQERGGFEKYFRSHLGFTPRSRTSVNSSTSWVTGGPTSSYTSWEKKSLPMTNGSNLERASKSKTRSVVYKEGKF